MDTPEAPVRHVSEGEIDLLVYWGVIWRQKIMILAVTVVTAVTVGSLSLLLPNIYRAEVLISPATEDGGSLSFSNALGSFGGLAGLSGLLPAGSQSTEEYLAVLRSRSFIWAFVEEQQLMPVLFADEWDGQAAAWKQPDAAPQMWDAYRLVVKDGLLTVVPHKDSGLFTLAVEWTDPALAALWANDLVARLNSFLRERERERTRSNLAYLNDELARTHMADVRQSLFALITKEHNKAMLVNTQKEYAFRILDPAVPPDGSSKPKRLLMAIFAGVLAGIVAVFIAFFREGGRRQG